MRVISAAVLIGFSVVCRAAADDLVQVDADEAAAVIRTPHFTAVFSARNGACTSLVSTATGEEISGGGLMNIVGTESTTPRDVRHVFEVKGEKHEQQSLTAVLADAEEGLVFEKEYTADVYGARLTIQLRAVNRTGRRRSFVLRASDDFPRGAAVLRFMGTEGAVTKEYGGGAAEREERVAAARPWWVAEQGRRLAACHVNLEGLRGYSVGRAAGGKGGARISFEERLVVDAGATRTVEFNYHVLPRDFVEGIRITGAGKGFIGGYVEEKGGCGWSLFPVVDQEVEFSVEKFLNGTSIRQVVTPPMKTSLRRGKAVEWHIRLKSGDIGRVAINDGDGVADIMFPEGVRVPAAGGAAHAAAAYFTGLTNDGYAPYYAGSSRALIYADAEAMDDVRMFVGGLDLSGVTVVAVDAGRSAATGGIAGEAVVCERGMEAPESGRDAAGVPAEGDYYDLVVISGRLGLNQYPEAMRRRVAAMVEKGAGLVLVNPRNAGGVPEDGILWGAVAPVSAKAGPEGVAETVMGEGWRSAVPNAITRGVPLAGLPFDKLSHNRYTARPEAKTYVESEGGDPIVCGWERGEGRAAAVTWWTGEGNAGMTAVETPRDSSRQVYWRHLYGLLQRTCLWAMDKSPEVGLSVRLEQEERAGVGETPRFRVEYENSAGFMFEGKLRLVVTNRRGEEAERSYTPLKVTEGPGFRSINSLVPMGGGGHVVEAALMQGEVVVEKAAADFQVQSPARVTGIEVGKPMQRDRLLLPVSVSYESSVNAVLDTALVDGLSRVLAFDRRTVAGPGRVETVLAAPETAAGLGRVETRFFIDGVEAERKFSGDVVLPQPKTAWNDFVIAVDRVTPGRYDMRERLAQLRAVGITAVTEPSRETGRGGLAYSRIMPKSGISEAERREIEKALWSRLLSDTPATPVVREEWIFDKGRGLSDWGKEFGRAAGGITNTGIGRLMSGIRREENADGRLVEGVRTADGRPCASTRREYAGGGAHYLALSNESSRAEEAVVTLKRTAHVYDSRRGEYVGETREYRCTAGPGETVFHALVPAKAAGLSVAGPAGPVTRGSEARFPARINYERETAGFRHVFAARLFYPNGKECTFHSRRIDAPGGSAVIAFHVAYNAPAGTWRLIVRDAATGLETQEVFTVQ
ncbi:MAG: hypothetical protein JW909_12045 [Planctomycetes bacterium]|nr:hypothetical protein [Planctomycetota bacterium]